MKALLSFLLGLTSMAACSAQGTISFVNDGDSLVTYTVGGNDPVEVGGAFVELLWAPGGTSLTSWVGQPLAEWLSSNPGWREAGSSIKPIGPLPGRFLGGTVVLPTEQPGGPVELLVVGWLGNHVSFDAALAGGSTGAFSEPFALQTGDPTTTPPGIPAIITGPNGFKGLGFYIPEPSAVLLILLGAGLFLRRRQQRP